MGETKKPRAMTAMRFAKAQLSGKATAEGFLQAHMMFLRGQGFLAPLLDAYENKELLPTVTLQAVQTALMTHVLEVERKTLEAKMAKRQDTAGKVRKPKGESAEGDEDEGSTARYTVTLMCKVYDSEDAISIQVGTVREIVGYKIRTAEGDTVVDTKDEADGHMILEKLFKDSPAVWNANDFGEAMRLADRRLFQREDSVYATIVNNFDRPITTNVQRGDAIARILRAKKGPASRTRGMSTKSLGFTPHVSQTRVTGPWSNRTR